MNISENLSSPRSFSEINTYYATFSLDLSEGGLVIARLLCEDSLWGGNHTMRVKLHFTATILIYILWMYLVLLPYIMHSMLLT